MEQTVLHKYNKALVFLLFAGTMLLGAGGSFFYQKDLSELIGITIFSGIGALCVFFVVDKSLQNKDLLMENDKSIIRFVITFFISLVCAFLFPLLPKEGCPYLCIFIGLLFFSDELIALSSGAVLLGISLLLRTDGDILTFFVYFIPALFGVLLFEGIKEQGKTGRALILSLLVQLLTLLMSAVLLPYDTFNFVMMMYPAANVLVNLLVLLIFLKIYSVRFIYQIEDKFMDINDPECDLLVQLKNHAKDEYYNAIHTAYLCSRIAIKLGINDAVCKACGYYHRIGMLKGNNDWSEVNEILLENRFPEDVIACLREYLDKDAYISSKEVVVLMFADTIVSSIRYLYGKEPDVELDYDKLVQAIFKKKLDSGIINYSKITLEDIQIMKKTFAEEKLYYDFLR